MHSIYYFNNFNKKVLLNFVVEIVIQKFMCQVIDVKTSIFYLFLFFSLKAETVFFIKFFNSFLFSHLINILRNMNILNSYVFSLARINYSSMTILEFELCQYGRRHKKAVICQYGRPCYFR